MKKLFALMLLVLCGAAGQARNPSDMKRYTKVPAGYLMVLREGDLLFEELERLAVAEKIPSASFTGMGFADVRFGYFDFGKKEYQPKDFYKVELASMVGTIAWKDGKPSIHCHGVVGNEDFMAHAGHILAATVSTGSMEITITVHNQRLERMKDESIGADVLQLK